MDSGEDAHPKALDGLQAGLSIEKRVKRVQQQGAQCKADQHGGEDVEDCGFHDGPLNERQASGVDVSRDKRSSEGGDCDAVVLRGVCASVNRARLLLRANVLVSLNGVCHGGLLKDGACAPLGLVVEVDKIKVMLDAV